MVRSLDFGPLFIESMRKIGSLPNITYKPSTIGNQHQHIANNKKTK